LLPTVLTGFALIVAAIVSVVVSYHLNTALLLVSFLLFSIGFGGADSPVKTIAMSGMPRTRSAVDCAIVTTNRLIGQRLREAAVAAAYSVDPDRWQTESSAVIDRIAPRFVRCEPLLHAGDDGRDGLWFGSRELLDHRRTPRRSRPGWVAASAVTGGIGRRGCP